MFQGCHCRVLESDSMAWKRPSTSLEQLAKVLHCIVMASKDCVKALPTTTAIDLTATARSCYESSCSSLGLEQEKYLLQAFSREKALAPRTLGGKGPKRVLVRFQWNDPCRKAAKRGSNKQIQGASQKSSQV